MQCVSITSCHEPSSSYLGLLDSNCIIQWMMLSWLLYKHFAYHDFIWCERTFVRICWEQSKLAGTGTNMFMSESWAQSWQVEACVLFLGNCFYWLSVCELAKGPINPNCSVQLLTSEASKKCRARGAALALTWQLQQAKQTVRDKTWHDLLWYCRHSKWKSQHTG